MNPAPITVEREIELCPCCALAAANSDESGCRDFHNHDEHALTALVDGEYMRLCVGDSLNDSGSIENEHECYGCKQPGTAWTAVILSR